MHLFEVKLFGKVGTPDLTEERPGQVDKFAPLEIGERVGILWVEVWVGNPILADNLFRPAQLSDLELVHHLVSRSTVYVFGRIGHGFAHVETGISEDEVIAARVIGFEPGEIVDLAAVGDPEGFGRVV